MWKSLYIMDEATAEEEEDEDNKKNKKLSLGKKKED